MIRTLCFVIWAFAAFLLLMDELLSISSRGAVPGIARVLEIASSKPYRVIVLFIGWMWLGWHLFAR